MSNDPLLDVAAALADGTPVDWESAARSITTEDDRRLLAELRFIGGIARPPLTPPKTELSIDSWGPLRIVEHVGRGTFGDVYRAWDSRLDREVALKLLRHTESDDEAHASTVIQEGRLLARVRHPNVVTVYGAERLNGQVGVWMEFIHGRTLEQELRDTGPFDVDRVITIGIELSGALATVHRAGLIHRDVKAHNVMRDADGRLVMTDFGAGCELDANAEDAACELAGTPVCVAPEVLAGQAVTPQSDIYSLGVLLYHLVTGTYPVRGRSLKEVRDAHARGIRTALRDARPDLPDTFIRIVDRALDPDPRARYEGPEALGAELAAFAAVTERERTRTKVSRTWKYAAIGVFLVVAAGFGPLARWLMPDTPTIAVLPFRNLSGEAESEYFVDGLTDEIIRNLSVIEGLEVKSQTSSFTFKDKPRDLRDVGHRLGANLVVEGSVLRSDGRLRVNAQLVRVADDVPLWSSRFDRELKDVFVIQDEISRSIVNELRLKLGRGQRRYNTNLAAYELYLKARAHVRHIGPAPARTAADLFEQVIAKDPAFAPAHAGFVDAWATMSINSSGAAADEAFAKMKPAAEKALQLDPLLAEAHAAMGVVLARDRNWNEAETAFRRALDLNRNLPTIRSSFVLSTLFPQGKVAEALNQVRAALSTDPLSLDLQELLAYVQVSAGEYDASIDRGRRIVATESASNHARAVLARALFQKGEKAEAINRLEQLGRGSDNFRGYAYGATGRRAEAEALAAQHKDFPARLVLIYAGLGDKDRTLEALDRMAAERDPRVGIYLTYPELAFIRDDPRLPAFRRKLGLHN